MLVAVLLYFVANSGNIYCLCKELLLVMMTWGSNFAKLFLVIDFG